MLTGYFAARRSYRSSGPTGGMPMTARRGRELEIGGQQPGPG
jgi:hypothetical protein